MTVADIKRLIVVFVVLCIVSGLVMIRLAFGSPFSLSGGTKYCATLLCRSFAFPT